jgi:hypothetical protein
VVNSVSYNVCILLFGQANVSLYNGTDILMVIVGIVRRILMSRVFSDNTFISRTKRGSSTNDNIAIISYQN